jgi:hypothetical protein
MFSFDESQAHLPSSEPEDIDELDKRDRQSLLRRAHEATRRARTSPSTFLFLPIQLSNSSTAKTRTGSETSSPQSYD